METAFHVSVWTRPLERTGGRAAEIQNGIGSSGQLFSVSWRPVRQLHFSYKNSVHNHVLTTLCVYIYIYVQHP